MDHTRGMYEEKNVGTKTLKRGNQFSRPRQRI